MLQLFSKGFIFINFFIKYFFMCLLIFFSYSTVNEKWTETLLPAPFVFCAVFYYYYFNQCLLSECCILNNKVVTTTATPQHGCDWCYSVFAEQKPLLRVHCVNPKSKKEALTINTSQSVSSFFCCDHVSVHSDKLPLTIGMITTLSGRL